MNNFWMQEFRDNGFDKLKGNQLLEILEFIPQEQYIFPKELVMRIYLYNSKDETMANHKMYYR